MYTGWGTSRSTRTTTVLSILSLTTVPTLRLRDPRSLSMAFSAVMSVRLPFRLGPQERDHPGEIPAPVADQHFVLERGGAALHLLPELLRRQFPGFLPLHGRSRLSRKEFRLDRELVARQPERLAGRGLVDPLDLVEDATVEDHADPLLGRP